MPGRKHIGPDAVSRHPGRHDTVAAMFNGTYTGELHRNILEGLRSGDSDTEDDNTEVYVSAVFTSALTSLCSVTWDVVREHMYSDKTMLKLVHAVENGIPDSQDELPEELRQFHQFRDDLSMS